MARPIGITVEIYEVTEAGHPVLTVTHVFYGATTDEAWAVEQAHRQTDSFYQAAVEEGRWRGIPLVVRWRRPARR